MSTFCLGIWPLAAQALGVALHPTCSAPQNNTGYYNSNQHMGLYELLPLPSSTAIAQGFQAKAQGELVSSLLPVLPPKRPRTGLR